jgi:uncharacterized protein
MTRNDPAAARSRGLAADADLTAQISTLVQIVRTNEAVARILERVPALRLPDWYLGAGGVTQTVWNHLHGFEPDHGIKDYDLVYCDGNDLSEQAETDTARHVQSEFADLGVDIDVKNQARVHLWYERRFGRTCPAYTSTAQAIATWPTTATAIGIRSTAGAFDVCTPFGMRDLFALIVRPNTVLVDESVFREKVERWRETWPRLTIVPWPS